MALVPSPANGNYREDDEEAGARAVFGAIRDRDLDTRQRLPQEVKSDPDKAARARKAALFLGGSPEAIERNMPEIEERQRVEAVAQGMSSSERLRRWYARPGMARVSHDDVDALRSTARPFEPDAITQAYQTEARQRTRDNQTADGILQSGLQFFKRGVGLFEGGLFTVGAALQDWSAGTEIPFYSDEVNARNRAESIAARDQLRARAQAAFAGGEIKGETSWEDVKARPSIGTVGSFVAQQGVQSLPQMAAAAFALPALVTSQSGNIGQQRAESNGEEYASIHNVLAAAPAALASSLLDRAGVSAIFSNAGKTAAKRIGIAAAGEGGTEFLQSGIEYAGGTIGTDAGFDWRQALDQSVAGLVAGAPLGGAFATARETVQVAATRSVQYIQARAGERLVDDIFNGAAKSKLRLRDPELFAEFLEQAAGGTAAANLYVPGDALRSLYQDENGAEIDRGEGAVAFDEFVPNFWDQLAQSSLTGGDVVIPMAKAAAYLAGTPEWDMLKGEARMAPGGFSPNEARAMEGDWASTIEDMGRRAYAAAQEDVEAAGPRNRVYQSVLSQARAAGFTLNASRAYADLWAERYQARAERLGTGADAWTLFEASLAGIQQAMPGSVETYRRGDSMDVLINAMRKGAEEMRPEGKPLLDRIMEGGGVIDAGGDIRSMGGDRVQKGGYFGRERKPLIRGYDAQGDTLGGGANADYGLDEWALRLWEEGYFPHAQDRPSVNDLLDLIGDALRGGDVLPFNSASPAVEANNEIVTAADDLRQLLFNAGLDPETASREEIDQAINAYRSDEGVYGFDQDYAVDQDGSAGWRPERISALLQQYAVDFEPTKTKSYVTRLDPNDFVESTTPIAEQDALRQEAGDLDADRLAGETQTPFLEIKLLDEEKGDLFSIVGHEGRHRMAALAAAGVRSVPVVLTRRDIGWSDLEPVDFPFLGRQRYGSAGEGSKGILPREIVPLNYANEERIREEFGAGSVMFQESVAGTSAFEQWTQGAPVVRSGEAAAHTFKTGEPVALEAFHGTARPDRIGDRFRKDRATAGPMAFFTASPALASSYAEGKQDTSIEEEEFDYGQWFKIKVDGGEPKPLIEAWAALPASVRVQARDLAPRVTLDWDTGEDIVLAPEGETKGIGSYDWEIKQARGNVAKALVESWLTSGALFDQEHKFLEVLRLVGIPARDVVYDNPHASYPAVFHTWVAMQNPLVVDDVPADVVASLEAAAAADTEVIEGERSYNWDKRNTTVREWVADFLNPELSVHAWTKIPDGVTAVFKAHGYDGIIDWSGKNVGPSGSIEGFPVYIPFEENQVKAYHNRGTFDPADSRMLYQSALTLPETIEVDGVERPARNSDGDPIARDEAGVRAFWEWFGESKAVDDQGRPLPLWHGTAGDFEAFNGMAWGAQDIELAGQYATMRSDMRAQPANVLPIYSRIERPFDADALPKAVTVGSFFNEALEQAQAAGNEIEIERARALLDTIRAAASREESGPHYDRHDFWNDPAMRFGADGAAAIREMFELLGFDGVKMRESATYGKQGEVTWGAFDPAQVKSTRNKGTFDRGDTRILHQPAYHGSPHTFDAFSTDFMGKGEGAQAFGWGLYFSGSREIADWYREKLATGDDNYRIGDTDEIFNPDALSHPNIRVAARRNATDVAATIRRVRQLLADANETTRPMLEEDLAALTEIEERGGLKPPGRGRLYEVDIPEDDEFLLWDQPMDRQPPKVREGIEAVLAMKQVAPEIANWVKSASGGNIYRMISGLPTKAGSPSITNEAAVSRALFAAGVKGSKYQAGQLTPGQPAGAFNYVVFDASAVRIAQMEQEGARGRIDFLADKRATITLFEGRDMSTLLHEGGHLWLEELRADALALSSGSVFADWETIKAWMKRETGLEISDDQPISTEAHELWARGMERYFLEGKPPSEALRSPFASFRAWLLRIYKIVKGLNSNIDDEVRSVFDRMLATDEAISFAQREGGDRKLFEDAAAAGMTEAEFKAYTDLVTESRTEAYDRLLFKTMERVRRERTVEHKERRAKLRLQVEEEIRARPEWQAIDLLRGNGDTYLPVSKESVIQRVGNDAWALLPIGRPGRPTFTDTGVDADLVAERAGFDTGQQMLEALMGIGMRRAQLREAGDRRSVLDEAIDVETDRRLAENYGDPLSDGSIEEEALEIIHTDAGAARLAAEVRQLAKQAGEAPTPADAIRSWAERVVGEARIIDQASGAAVDRHRRAEAKAGRAAEQAYLNGDFETAFREKQKQQIANALLRASRDARDKVDVIGRRLDRYSRSRGYKGMAPDYLDRIHELLEQFDLKRRTEKLVKERESFDKWAARQREMGIEVSVPERLTLAGDKHFTRLTFDEVVALDDAVESLANLGRQKTRLKTDQEERDLEALVGQAAQTAQALPTRPWDNERNRPRNIPREINAALAKVEFVADYLDNGDPNGVFNEVLVKGSTRAANKLEELQRQVMDPLAKLYLDMPAKEKRRFSERISVEEFVSADPETREVKPTVFLRSELIAVALNVGNKSNLEKMLEGESKALEEILGERGAARHAWTEEKVMAVLNRHLSENDWQFVETVWDRVNSLWPDIVEAERELTGITPEKVIGRPVETRFGTVQGGYYPIVYDPNRSQMASDNADQEAADMFGAIGRFVGTPKGHTISRTSAAMPITFSLERVLFSHVKKVSTRIAYGRYVRDTMKFVSHPKIRRVFDEHLGMEYHAQLKPWLRDQVQDASLDLKHLSALDRILRQFRVNMTLVGLGFRFTTMLAQIAGWHNAQAEIGSKWLLRGVKEMAKDAGSIRSFVFDRSEEMASRAQAFDRDIRLFYQEAGQGGRREGSGWMDKAARAADAAGVPKLQAAAFWGIGMIDVYMVAMPTWLGAYYKALETQGMSEAEAAAAGDKAVRKSQSAGRMKDLAALQRGPEGLRVLTTFYSYFNILYNKQFETVTLVKRGRESGRRGDKAAKSAHWRQAAMNVWWIMLIAPVTSALLTGDLPDEEERDLEGWTAWAANRIFFGLWAGVPGIRDVASKWQRKVEGEYAGSIQSPFFNAFEAAERPLDDLFKVLQGDEPSDRWIKNAIVAPGYFLGLPTGQLGSTVQYAHDVATGDQEPEGVGDVLRGVAKGPQKDQE